MQALNDTYPGCFNGLTQTVIDAALSSPASSIQLIRSWLLELFVRGVVPITPKDVKQLDTLNSALDKRQLLLIRGRAGDTIYFRSQKTRVDQFTGFEHPYLLWGATCLPKDEFEKGLMPAVRPQFGGPIGPLFIKWVEQHRTEMLGILSTGLEDSSDPS